MTTNAKKSPAKKAPAKKAAAKKGGATKPSPLDRVTEAEHQVSAAVQKELKNLHRGVEKLLDEIQAVIGRVEDAWSKVDGPSHKGAKKAPAKRVVKKAPAKKAAAKKAAPKKAAAKKPAAKKSAK